MDWDWNGIRHFTTLVEKQTLTAAAEHLGVQHSTVSRQIAQLENALGLRLFDRISKRYLLTPEGERLYRHACEICKDMSMLHAYRARTGRAAAQRRHFRTAIRCSTSADAPHCRFLQQTQRYTSYHSK